MELRGVRVHNLKNVDLDIPLNQLVVVSGVSGSGKTSLAFETLFREGQHRYIESFSVSARRQLERIERPDADRIAHVPVAIAVRSDRSRGSRPDPRSTVASVGELLDGFRMLFSRLGQINCPCSGSTVTAHSVADVSQTIAALPDGTRCQLGFVASASSEGDPIATWLARGYSRAIWSGTTHDLGSKPAWPKTEEVWIVADRLVAGKASPERRMESIEAAFREGEGRCWLLVDAEQSSTYETRLVDGRCWRLVRFSRRLECGKCRRQFLPLEPRLFSHFSAGACPLCRGTGLSIHKEIGSSDCESCFGDRLREEARAVRVAGRSLPEVCRLNLTSALNFVRELGQSLPLDKHRLTELIRADLVQRLTAANRLGLSYLTLDRAADSLSGGELRRLMLAAVIGSRLTGTLVVVDEPSAGLTEAELPSVIAALRQVLSLRNSVVVVDHSPAIVAAADHVIELGPGAGPTGGSIVFQGRAVVPDVSQENGPVRRSLVPNRDQPQKSSKKRSSNTTVDNSVIKDRICLTNVRHHNLKDVSVEFPLNQLCVVTGPSGSGKTSLLTQVLFPVLCSRLSIPCEIRPRGDAELSGGTGLTDVVLIDQSPLTASARSNPATWLEVFDEIRQTFASTADAKQRGFTAQYFSFNSSSGGRCRSCKGTGLLKHDMQFLPDVTLTCPECHGTRYRNEILEVKYRGRSIADVLAMSVSEAAVFFRSQSRIQARFQMLKEIGLDYLVLGQPSESLSGGEAQRLKLAARLVTPNRGPTLILCDDPTTGLHPRDVKRLVICFRELIANGHSLILADNSPELIAEADDVLELKH
jgi:excinuclease ABC subunit A